MKVMGRIYSNGDVKIIVRTSNYDILHEELLITPNESEIVVAVTTAKSICKGLIETKARNEALFADLGVERYV